MTSQRVQCVLLLVNAGWPVNFAPKSHLLPRAPQRQKALKKALAHLVTAMAMGDREV